MNQMYSTLVMDNLILVLKSPEQQCTKVKVGSAVFGSEFVVIAGPCSVETESQTRQIAIAVKKSGAKILRAGVFKPRTSPHSFQGLGFEGLKILSKIRDEVNLPIVTEVLDTRDVEVVSEYVDMIQIGSRSMQNFSLLKTVGKTKKPILLKRGMHSTILEWLGAAEYILAEGNPHVVLCERGIRTFETYTRNTLDLNAVAALRGLTHLPVIVDPSHGVGISSLVSTMAIASIAAGAQGLMIEVHNNPEEALSDKDQAITPEQFDQLMKNALIVHECVTNLN